MDIVVRETGDIKDLEVFEDIQRRAWQMRDIGIIPKTILKAIYCAGGFVAGAWYGDRIVGFSFAFRGFYKGENILWSHMTAVLPEYQGKGIGYKLKIFQKEWALRNNIKLICWTFDPFSLKNAYFNFGKLKVISNTYEKDIYGAMYDKVNEGKRSDRLIVEWWLEKKFEFKKTVSLNVPFLSPDISKDEEIRKKDNFFEKLKNYFDDGYYIIDFDKERGKYILGSF